MACFLITETMARRHELSMASYDRLFPNQDTIPRGGFGNLIALPLQHGPRQEGNTVFVDDRLVPYADQWAFLGGIVRLDPATVERIARDAIRKGLVVGVRLSDTGDDEESAAPWTRRPSGKPPATRFGEPLLDQWIAQLSMFLGIAPTAIGQIGAGKRTPNGRLDVAMLQSLVRLGRVDDLVATYGHVIVDECHHVPAASFERVLSEVKAALSPA